MTKLWRRPFSRICPIIKFYPISISNQNYIKILRDHRVTHLVCATDPTYKTEDIEHEGVRFTSIPFPDGSPPTAEVNIIICPSGDFRGCASLL